MSSRPPSVLIPLPDRDFDTTESSIAWRAFVDAGIEVTFATETGRVAACDQRLLRTGFFNWFPAGQDALDAYRAMSSSPARATVVTSRCSPRSCVRAALQSRGPRRSLARSS